MVVESLLTFMAIGWFMGPISVVMRGPLQSSSVSQAFDVGVGIPAGCGTCRAIQMSFRGMNASALGTRRI